MNKDVFLIRSLFLVAFLMWQSPVMAQHYYFDWAKGFIASGGNSNTSDDVSGGGLAIDNNGNVYAVGSYNCDSADFDPGPGIHYLYCTGSSAVFVSKLDAGGNYVWAKSIRGSASAGGSGITTDTAGNVYITGAFTGTVDFDPGPNTANLTAHGGGDVFVCKLDNNGDYVWARNLGGIETETSFDIAIDAAGNTYITGRFSGTADFDPGPNTVNLTANGDKDVFVCKLDQAGNYVWARSWGGSGFDWGGAVSVDAAGNVYTTGVFWFTVDFDPGPNTANLSAVTYAAFVSKLDASGNFVWAKTMRGGGNAGYDLVAGNTGIYITGTFLNTVDFDPGPNTANLVSGNGSDNIFVCKLDTAGNYLWAKSIGGPGSGDWGWDIAVDAVDNVYTLARFTDTVDFDPGPGTINMIPRGTRGFGDLAILKLDPAGNYLWSGTTGCREVDYAGDIQVSSGNIYVMGEFYADTVDADPTSGVFQIAPYSDGYYPGGTYISKVLCGDTSSLELTVDTCNDYALGNRTYTADGTYIQTLSGVFGCDSIVTLHLTITRINPVITVSEFLLGTTERYDSYQWLLNDGVIQGATDSTYAVAENGNYRVAVRRNACRDTSAAYEVNNVGISFLNGIAQQVTVYPNPANDIVYIQSPVPVNVTLAGIEGKIIRRVSDEKYLSIGGLAEGIYFLRITDDSGNLIRVEKIIRQGQ